MNEERKTYMEDEDIENLLSPKCDFHPSPGFMERVLAEAEAETYSSHKRRHKLWWVYSGAAAAVAALVVITILIDNKVNTKTDTPMMASVLPVIEESHQNILISTTMKEEISEEKSETRKIPKEKNKIMANKNVIKEESVGSLEYVVETHETASSEEIQNDMYVQTEGPMASRQDAAQKNSDKMMLSTDDFDNYTRLRHQTYIERVRYEIAETDEYVKEMRESVLESI